MLEKLQSIKNCLIKISVFSSCSVHAVKVSGFVDGGGGGCFGVCCCFSLARVVSHI